MIMELTGWLAIDRQGEKKVIMDIKRKKKITGNITQQEPEVTMLVLTSIMLFAVLKCYSLF